MSDTIYRSRPGDDSSPTPAPLWSIRIVRSDSDPNGIAAHEPGAKLDALKIPVSRGCFRQFPRALAAVAELSAIGAAKYSWQGWASVPDGQQRYADARARHELAIGRGEIHDNETLVLHLTAVAWNALAELELKIRGDGVANDRSAGHPRRSCPARGTDRSTGSSVDSARRGMPTCFRGGNESGAKHDRSTRKHTERRGTVARPCAERVGPDH